MPRVVRYELHVTEPTTLISNRPQLLFNNVFYIIVKIHYYYVHFLGFLNFISSVFLIQIHPWISDIKCKVKNKCEELLLCGKTYV